MMTCRRLMLGCEVSLPSLSITGCGDDSLFFFFQAEDGIRDLTVTGVQTCALPISHVCRHAGRLRHRGAQLLGQRVRAGPRRGEGHHSMTRVRATTVAPLLAVALAGCRNGKAAARESGASTTAARVEGPRVILPEGSPQLASLSVAAAAPSVPRPVRLNGRIVWNEDVTVRIFSAFAGRVVKGTVDAGQPVQPGDVLATIASPDFGQAQADARRAVTDLAFAQQT